MILEDYAASDILDYLAYLGFGAQPFQEKRSFMSGHLGEKVVGENVTIWDDGLSPDTIPMPFDFEGVPKQRVELITDGVANGVVYDSYYGGKEGKPSTGHALPAGATYGPLPMNLFLKAGDATREDMLASVERGIWVSRFWYTRPVHPLKVIVTGMTRDGTFLIEKGKITAPIKNLRFTQSYLDALNQVEMISRETRLAAGHHRREPRPDVEGEVLDLQRRDGVLAPHSSDGREVDDDTGHRRHRLHRTTRRGAIGRKRREGARRFARQP